ncbi:MAG: hypothetical protein EBV03_08230 [Proteobacteria bacterium]|nr:hypothetical protein [Pseudomonadota bacterium]
MNELLRELEDDIRRERFDKLWHSFGKMMVWVSLGVIIVTIAVVIIQNHRQNAAMEKTTDFIRGIDRLQIEDFKGAIPVFEGLAQDESSPYYGLAMLRIAQAKQGLSDQAGAQKAYETLAEKDPVFGALASLMLPPQGGDVVKPDRKSPFYFTLAEMRGWQLLKIGKRDNAIAQFLALYQDKECPFSMRLRITEALQHLAPQRLMDVDELLKKQNAAAQEPTEGEDHAQ